MIKKLNIHTINEGMLVKHTSTYDTIWKVTRCGYGIDKDTIGIECIDNDPRSFYSRGYKGTCDVMNLYIYGNYKTNQSAKSLLEEEY